MLITRWHSWKGVPAPLPHFKVPTSSPKLPPFLKIFVSRPLFFVPPPFKVFQTVPPPHPHTNPSCPNLTHQPSSHIINVFKQISKGWFYQFNCRLLSKINFDFLNPITNVSGYLNLCDIFRFIFRQLSMTFFHKIIVAEKNSFSSNT